ncbi:MAG: tetratricopeptide repeat protein [Nitrospirota bacterium]
MEAQNKIELGLIYYQEGDLQNARNLFEETLKVHPTNFDALYYLAIVNYQMENYDEAHLNIKKVLNKNPINADANNVLGNILMVTGQLDEAIIYYQKAVRINSNFADAYNNLGMVYKQKAQLDGAINYFQKALEINPNFVEAHMNLAFALLLSGQFRKGWEEYAWRWRLEDALPDICYSYIPIWDGSNIKGRTILLHAEQGFGDTIQFIRYAPLVAKLGADVIIDSPEELMPLIKGVEGIKQVIRREEWDEDQINIDMRCPLLDLPLIFNTTLENIPSQVPYITVDPLLVQKWGDRIKRHENAKFKIGLVWAGSISKKKLLHRSDSLDIFSPLAELNNVVFYSLQKGEASIQAKKGSYNLNIVDFTDDIHDFADTAAIIENLDLVISVDTAVAHLAGALSKPVWTLIPFVPDWRWLLNRDDSPWYPTMRLFRQPAHGDWQSVIAKVKDELLNLMCKN